MIPRMKMEWISVEDEDVPKEGSYLLLYYGAMAVGEYVATYTEDDGEYPHFLCGSDVIYNVTHWMPLPQPPER